MVVGQALAGYSSSPSSLTPGSLGSIVSTANSDPMTSQTTFATLLANNTLPYEVGGLTVTVVGVAVPVVYASPSTVKFFMPVDVPLGTLEIIVSSQDGYVCQGFVTVDRLSSRLLTIADDDSGKAIASNGITGTTAAFDVVTPQNFGSDKRTRLNIFATGISGSASNTNPGNDVVAGGRILVNYAESIVVQARRTDGRVFNLPVEFAGAPGVLPGLDQIIAVLIPDLKGAGTIQLKVIVGGHESNGPTVFIR